jgi:hypothetical protein
MHREGLHMPILLIAAIEALELFVVRRGFS